jgi:hypothetical protein
MRVAQGQIPEFGDWRKKNVFISVNFLFGDTASRQSTFDRVEIKKTMEFGNVDFQADDS